MLERYMIEFPAADLETVRNVLGTRPYDEVAHIIGSMHRQIAAQQRAAIPRPAPAPEPEPAAGGGEG